jgi:hypothetical protein
MNFVKLSVKAYFILAVCYRLIQFFYKIATNFVVVGQQRAAAPVNLMDIIVLRPL